MPHRAKMITELGPGAKIDIEVAELVLLLTRKFGAVTTSSCQGNPGEIPGTGTYGHVATKETNYKVAAKFCFGTLAALLQPLLDDGSVILEMTLWSEGRLLVWVMFRNEAIPRIVALLSK